MNSNKFQIFQIQICIGLNQSVQDKQKVKHITWYNENSDVRLRRCRNNHGFLVLGIYALAVSRLLVHL